MRNRDAFRVSGGVIPDPDKLIDTVLVPANGNLFNGTIIDRSEDENFVPVNVINAEAKTQGETKLLFNIGAASVCFTCEFCGAAQSLPNDHYYAMAPILPWCDECKKILKELIMERKMPLAIRMA